MPGWDIPELMYISIVPYRMPHNSINLIIEVLACTYRYNVYLTMNQRYGAVCPLLDY